MAGHSKWANIKHRKGAQDAKRGKLFTKIAKEITVAAKLGGDDPDGNPRLRAAMTKARGVSMPKDNIDRAIKRGVGGQDTADYTEKTYEGYGPAGVAVMVECLTDNINRTVSEVRHAFSRSGGNLGTDGSVNWMFHRKGTIVYAKDKIESFEAFFEAALEAGAADVKEEGDVYEIECEPDAFSDLKDALDQLNIEADHADVGLVPENYTELDEEKAAKLTKLIDTLEDNDDVQNVYHNGQFPDED
ncbi:YebC/PmpR family DNA-binding transcriptional regulator [Pseudobacteriovorax antillogorgiicola]|uniref:Probable transcriptional regulatory protein SAMN06296036_12649 n=1 Tax=Pseudobacteriovorax antillogorgiicola TaxID=1513793 RepID=A0A1Y6CSU1_9BACT|nr:YebC/PmpR family DNA-binding transcriptional regulator [Pseudobacteriovorax antillogorgiicola]TCS45886.1 YebC/PmpR family DNA-binding regulatory protein [Pseudobacteriovorax antillogorgiicola]SMF71191.1 DNA-binding regulatory protein, YebC/PmpR family [Pseudobacteriovorax antillogorgiicola]